MKSCYSTKGNNGTLSFHKGSKCGSEKDATLNLFGKTKYVDKRSEWLRALNVVDSNKEFFFVHCILLQVIITSHIAQNIAETC